jgi:hypothetical protein
MPLLRRFGFLAVVAAGAALFGAGVQGVREVDTTLQVAAEERTPDRPVLVRYDPGSAGRQHDLDRETAPGAWCEGDAPAVRLGDGAYDRET